MAAAGLTTAAEAGSPAPAIARKGIAAVARSRFLIAMGLVLSCSVVSNPAPDPAKIEGDFVVPHGWNGAIPIRFRVYVA